MHIEPQKMGGLDMGSSRMEENGGFTNGGSEGVILTCLKNGSFVYQ